MEKLTLQVPQPRAGQIDQETLTIIEQLTLLKLDYARAFLAKHEESYSGVRMDVRQGLTALLEKQPGLQRELRALLDELDMWGNQRIRLRHFAQKLIKDCGSAEGVKKRAGEAGMSELVDRRIDLTPPETTAPMSISYEERGRSRFLKLVAARTRVQFIPEPDTKEVKFKEYPDIVFRAFKKETQKVINFAEINLSSGEAIISSPLVRPGFTVTNDFKDFYDAFAPFISLDGGEELPLFNATHNVRYVLQRSDLLIRGRKMRTNHGGTISLNSCSPKVDMRTDEQLAEIDDARPDTKSHFCNCHWAAINGLNEIVHTHLLASEGEVVIMGQVREQSVRHVLQRIRSIN